MPDTPANTGSGDWLAPGKKNVTLVYILYLAGFVLGGLSMLVGLVFCYVNRGGADQVSQTHYRYAIRTFWIGLLYSLISAMLMIVGIGFLLIVAVAVWVIVRCVKGLQAASAGTPITNVETWLL
jgi:uncharacterized membrane protein